MSVMNFNDAEPQRESGGLIPEGTIALAVMTLRPGGFGDDGFIAKSKSSGNDMLDAEFTVAGGPFERRKVWKYFSLGGDAVSITRSQLRAALESAFNIDPGDMSDAAMGRRSVPSYGSFDGLTVCIKVGIEKGKDSYPDKNVIRAFITPDQKGYINPGPQSLKAVNGASGAGVSAAVASQASQASQAAKAGGSATRPAWANP